MRSLHLCQGTNGLVYVASNNDRSVVVGAKHDFNNMFDYELRGAFVLGAANVVTLMLVAQATTGLISVAKSSLQRVVLELVKLT